MLVGRIRQPSNLVPPSKIWRQIDELHRRWLVERFHAWNWVALQQFGHFGHCGQRLDAEDLDIMITSAVLAIVVAQDAKTLTSDSAGARTSTSENTSTTSTGMTTSLDLLA